MAPFDYISSYKTIVLLVEMIFALQLPPPQLSFLLAYVKNITNTSTPSSFSLKPGETVDQIQKGYVKWCKLEPLTLIVTALLSYSIIPYYS